MRNISRVWRKSPLRSPHNYLQQTERKRMLFSRALAAVTWMKSREISSLGAERCAPPFTNLATSRLTQLRQLITARPLCGNRPSRNLGREERNKGLGEGGRTSGVRRIAATNFQFQIRLFTLLRFSLFFLIVLPRALLSDRECAQASWKFMQIYDR